MSAGAESMPIATLRRIGSVAVFLGHILAQVIPAFGKPRLIVAQIYNAGARSLVIIMMSGLFVGMVLGLQGFDLLQRFGSEDALGVAAALGLLKELGPVVTALLFAGRAGTSLTSEIGLMKATDQLTAMQMMAVDPVRYVVAPRFIGGFVAMPLLNAIFCGVGLFGAQLIGVSLMGVDSGAFWSQTQNAVELNDVAEEPTICWRPLESSARPVESPSRRRRGRALPAKSHVLGTLCSPMAERPRTRPFPKTRTPSLSA